MMGRRLMLGGMAALPFGQALASLPIPPGDRLGFHIIRKGSTIGEHTLTFDRSVGGLMVSVAVDIVVGFGPITFFRYKHRAIVHWQGNEVVSVDAETNDDGTHDQMTARRDEGGLVVESSHCIGAPVPLVANNTCHTGGRLVVNST